MSGGGWGEWISTAAQMFGGGQQAGGESAGSAGQGQGAMYSSTTSHNDRDVIAPTVTITGLSFNPPKKAPPPVSDTRAIVFAVLAAVVLLVFMRGGGRGSSKKRR